MVNREKDNSSSNEGTLFHGYTESEIPQAEPPAEVPDDIAGDVEPEGFVVPPSARPHIDNAQNPHLRQRADTLADQQGGQFAAELSTYGSRAVTGRLPGEPVPKKTDKPKGPNRWDNVRRYASPRDKGAPPHIAKEIRGE